MQISDQSMELFSFIIILDDDEPRILRKRSDEIVRFAREIQEVVPCTNLSSSAMSILQQIAKMDNSFKLTSIDLTQLFNELFGLQDFVKCWNFIAFLRNGQDYEDLESLTSLSPISPSQFILTSFETIPLYVPRLKRLIVDIEVKPGHVVVWKYKVERGYEINIGIIFAQYSTRATDIDARKIEMMKLLDDFSSAIKPDTPHALEVTVVEPLQRRCYISKSKPLVSQEMLPESSDHSVVQPWDCEDDCQHGTYDLAKCWTTPDTDNESDTDTGGVCRIIFDNEFSTFAGKHIEYCFQCVDECTWTTAVLATADMTTSLTRPSSKLHNQLINSKTVELMVDGPWVLNESKDAEAELHTDCCDGGLEPGVTSSDTIAGHTWASRVKSIAAVMPIAGPWITKIASQVEQLQLGAKKPLVPDDDRQDEQVASEAALSSTDSSAGCDQFSDTINDTVTEPTVVNNIDLQEPSSAMGLAGDVEMTDVAELIRDSMISRPSLDDAMPPQGSASLQADAMAVLRQRLQEQARELAVARAERDRAGVDIARLENVIASFQSLVKEVRSEDESWRSVVSTAAREEAPVQTCEPRTSVAHDAAAIASSSTATSTAAVATACDGLPLSSHSVMSVRTLPTRKISSQPATCQPTLQDKMESLQLELADYQRHTQDLRLQLNQAQASHRSERQEHAREQRRLNHECASQQAQIAELQAVEQSLREKLTRTKAERKILKDELKAMRSLGLYPGRLSAPSAPPPSCSSGATTTIAVAETVHGTPADLLDDRGSSMSVAAAVVHHSVQEQYAGLLSRLRALREQQQGIQDLLKADQSNPTLAEMQDDIENDICRVQSAMTKLLRVAL